MKSSNVILGFLGGMAVGAVLGVLLAPEKGSETRKKISKKTGDLSDSLRDKFNEFGEAIADKFDSIRGEANEIMEKGKDKAQNLKDEAKRNFA